MQNLQVFPSNSQTRVILMPRSPEYWLTSIRDALALSDAYAAPRLNCSDNYLNRVAGSAATCC
jgi:hypothetical protein